MSTLNIDGNFDWFDVLEQLKDGAKPNEGQTRVLENRAGDWVTCACGQLCKLLPRQGGRAPTDKTLEQLGIAFARYIGGRDWVQAFHTLNKIEARSAKLLCDMGVPVIMVDHPRRFERAPEIKSFAVEMADHGKGFKRQEAVKQ